MAALREELPLAVDHHPVAVARQPERADVGLLQGDAAAGLDRIDVDCAECGHVSPCFIVAAAVSGVTASSITVPDMNLTQGKLD
jgi:hypothetical protein